MRAGGAVRLSGVVALAVVAVLTLPTAGLGMAGLGGVPAAPAMGGTGRSIATSAPPASEIGSPVASPSPAPPPGFVASKVVRSVAAAISTDRVPSRYAFPPSPYVHVGPTPAAGVTPEPLVSPASMGVADLGIGKSGDRYQYETKSFEGTLNVSSFAAYSPGYPTTESSPDWTSLQLNAVAVNVSYPGAANGTFWLQNVASLNGTELELEDNIWNFSSPTAVLPPSTIYSHGAGGVVALGTFYYDLGPVFRVSYPFSLTLSVAVFENGSRADAAFNYSITNGSGTVHKSFDSVLFNGVVTGHLALKVSGKAYDPFGNEYDSEFVFGGNGGGSNANFAALSGNATLAFWNETAGRYDSVRSAYDHGVDSGETATGLSAYYLNRPHPVEYLTAGPSFLYGLWNTSASKSTGPSAPNGWIDADLSVSPTFAFLFATNKSSSTRPLVHANFTYAPTTQTGLLTARLPAPVAGNPYVFEAWADGFLTGSLEVVGNGTGALPLTLSSSPGTLNAPIYLAGAAQLAAFGAAKVTDTGYAPLRGPTLWINTTTVTLAPPFLRVNDFDYPTFLLFAADHLNGTVRLDRLTQSASSFSFFSSYSLASTTIDGWSQGYFFYYGTGHFSVANTTIEGNSTLYDLGYRLAPGIEFYDTSDPNASHVVASQDAVGVEAVRSTGATIDSVDAGSGAVAAAIANSTHASVASIAANGADPAGIPSLGVWLYGATDARVAHLAATNGSTGVIANLTSGLTVTGVTDTSTIITPVAHPSTAVVFARVTTATVRHLTIAASIGFEANDSSALGASDINASDGGYVGEWQNTTGVTVVGVNVTDHSFGLDFLNDSAVTVKDASATDHSTAIDLLYRSTGGTFTGISASASSVAFNASFASDFAVSNVVATLGSLGLNFDNTSNFAASDLAATGGSDAFLWDFGTNGTVSDVTAGGLSLGAAVANATAFHVQFVNATNATLSANVSLIPAAVTYEPLPAAAVVAVHDSGATISNVTVHDYPFAVWGEYVNGSTFSNLKTWYDNTSLVLNASVDDEIAAAFVYGSVLGALLTGNVTGTLVTASTFEGCTSYAVDIDNGTRDHVYSNNFVANNGASTIGTFVAGHDQIEANGTDVYLNSSTGHGNYWSDHLASGTYTAYANHSAAAVDHDPGGVELRTWLKFAEVGLPAGTPWGFAVLGTNYTATVPLVYIPSEDLPELKPIAFTVLPPIHFIPTPPSGTVPALGAGNRTQTITFTEQYAVTFSETGLAAAKSWSVTFNGVPQSSTAATNVFYIVSGGPYTYSVPAIPGWTESGLARSGTISVSGAAVNPKAIVWSQTTFLITFTEHGLTGSPQWTVTINGTTSKSTTGSALTFPEPNGTYSYTITSPSGFSASVSSGHETVADGPVAVAVDFSTSSTTPAASPPWTLIAVGAGAAIAVLAGVVLLLRRRRAPPPRPPRPVERDDPF